MEVSDRATPVTIGRLFADKYRVDGVLGNGGMGMVFAATHLQLETRVAIKLLRADASRTETATARLLREARATAKINSENVARVLDIG
ncbi:MAG TPA: serine/threonine protein kinase, partial [Polyangia bacterium]|nr:serine/threonine protein kinase [Polyangia bacterium]